MENLNNIIADSSSARDALKQLNEVAGIAIAQSVLFVINDAQQVVGTLSDGDIRRGLINGLMIDEPVSNFMFRQFRFIKKDFTSEEVNVLRAKRIRFVPMLDENRRIISIVDLNDLHAVLPVDAVIMAGGKGKRLLPLTENLPKPLLKVGDKPIIEHNIDRLTKYGVTDFYITVKYLGHKITDYFGDGRSKNVSIQYSFEEEELGTMGAVSLIHGFRHDHVLVMNSDLLTNIDFKDFYDYFIEQEADMAIASIPYHVDIPYAVFELSEGKAIHSFREKPRYTYYSNAGVYLIRKELVDFIPANTKFDATDMMQMMIGKGKKVISYPITGYWLDIGRMEDYIKAQEDIKHLSL